MAGLQGTDFLRLSMKRRVDCHTNDTVMNPLIPGKFMRSVYFAAHGYIDQILHLVQWDDGPEFLRVFGIVGFGVGEAFALDRTEGAFAAGI